MPDSYKRHTGSRKEARGSASKQPSSMYAYFRRYGGKIPKRCNKENNDPHHHYEQVQRRFRPTKAVVLAAADSDEQRDKEWEEWEECLEHCICAECGALANLSEDATTSQMFCSECWALWGVARKAIVGDSKRAKRRCQRGWHRSKGLARQWQGYMGHASQAQGAHKVSIPVVKQKFVAQRTPMQGCIRIEFGMDEEIVSLEHQGMKWGHWKSWYRPCEDCGSDWSARRGDRWACFSCAA